MKQETLEEFIERTIDESFEIQLASSKIEKYIKLGAKWQQERSYSEEEVLDLIKARQMSLMVGISGMETQMWFEQFKKK